MIPRRRMLQAATAACLPISPFGLTSLGQPPQPRPIRIGIMGLSRGLDLAKDLAKLPGVSIKYACDPDRQRLASGCKRIEEMSQNPIAVNDFRQILDDPEVDALVCAAPNHWHGPATILGCKAGKHVYVEKPCSHNPAEGIWMAAAASKYRRCVQVGTQRRSSVSIREAIHKLQSGAIGHCYLARCNFQRTRASIGKGEASSPPAELHYDLWQGPAPKRAYRSNVVHYNWHWFWHYGNGELGNNGIHCLDLCRWGLEVDYPSRVVQSGGKFVFQDDQETPDTQSVAFEFGSQKQITFQGSSRNQNPAGPFVQFYGTEGSMEIGLNGDYKIYDANHKEVANVPASGWGQAEHLANFVEAVRLEDPTLLHQPVLEGHKSTHLCHLGNIAYRLDRSLRCDPADGSIQPENDLEAVKALWQREYDPAWESQIITP